MAEQGSAGAASARPAERRVRDKEARRAAIIAAARAAFAEQGYAKTTIREIARRAKVTHGLVMLHFSTKEQLFLAAMPGTGDLSSFVEGDLATLPDRIARAYVQRMESASSADPFLALIRSAATDQDAAKKLLLAMGHQGTERYRAVLPVADIEIRVASLGAYLIGVTFSRYVLREGPLAAASLAELEACLVPAIRGILLKQT